MIMADDKKAIDEMLYHSQLVEYCLTLRSEESCGYGFPPTDRQRQK